MPCENVSHISEASAPVLEVPNVYHRSLVEVITSAFKDSTSKQFHFTPFRLFWQPSPDVEPERVITELYNSEAFLGEYEQITRKLKPTPPGTVHIETCIAAMMLWSDSTHLASFGDASLWPLYLYFGNQSQYFRSKPNNFAAHHVAYIPSLPDNLQDIYMEAYNGAAASEETIRNMKRDLMHAVWLLLLDGEFMDAYENGILIKCTDGITRHYPEKVLLATIRFLGKSLCTGCTIYKKFVSALGTRADDQRRNHERKDTKERQRKVETSRSWIFEYGGSIKSQGVENVLADESYVPARNAFSTRLFGLGFNFFSMFVPDLLHEFELGVWKAVFIHLMRILYSCGENYIQKLNKRYRQVQTFGRSTIRRFSTNASAMKKLAARDYENLLQCSMPVFEGLLPNQKHDAMLQDLLFILCTWHAYAKLRMHTMSSLTGLKATTRSLGQALRDFSKKLCPKYDTKELPKEEAARARRARKSKGKGKASSSTTANTAAPSAKVFNMFTFKLHHLGHYLKAIWQYGPSSGYSTQTGELEHRRVKKFYARTNKGRKFEHQITRHQRRERILRRIANRVKNAASESAGSLSSQQYQYKRGATTHLVPFEDSESLQPILPELHHYISNGKNSPINIFQWIYDNNDDEALTRFVPKLKDHLLSRLLGHDDNSDESLYYTDEDRHHVRIIHDRMYKHKRCRVNYTSYDLRRCQDTMNPTSHADIMVLSGNEELDGHPFAYARILGVYHVDIKHTGPKSRSNLVHRMDFLWVRWFELDSTFVGGWETRRLHRLQFVESDSSAAFGFLDPSLILRGSHLISAFAHGTTTARLGPSIARVSGEKKMQDKDWNYYYVNMFVDRDMFVRYLGGGIGHQATNEYTADLRPNFEARDLFTGYKPGDNQLQVDSDSESDQSELEAMPSSLNHDKEYDIDNVDTEDEDWGYKSSNSSQDSESELEDPEVIVAEEAGAENEFDLDDLGPGDGEAAWESDDYEAEGYAEL
ncbi:hypothetical protein JR316_0010562 [Psilocybe cubensis]|uniref:Uncharacterized protein n=1 Tax=Psilocybe cubensis TaxID=181762 RepID=A0ACB8GM54_PSICU|nr:hypothetical protein JR316_0010562 [Psilocybe cubensis]KAH9476649.1 hypothetical protein JR316_0010562 [Psilocybe cubensis]